MVKAIFKWLFKLYYKLYPDTLLWNIPIDNNTDVQYVINRYYESNGIKYHRRGLKLKRYDEKTSRWVEV